MVRRILNRLDRKYDEVLDQDDNEFVMCTKAFGIGAAEGFIDGLVIVGLFGFIGGVIDIVKDLKKK